MRIGLVDMRPIGLAVNGGAGVWYNWTTGVFETPWNASNHIKVTTADSIAGGMFLNLKFAEIGIAMTSRPGSVLVAIELDGSGVPVQETDAINGPVELGVGITFLR